MTKNNYDRMTIHWGPCKTKLRLLSLYVSCHVSFQHTRVSDFTGSQTLYTDAMAAATQQSQARWLLDLVRSWATKVLGTLAPFLYQILMGEQSGLPEDEPGQPEEEPLPPCEPSFPIFILPTTNITGLANIPFSSYSTSKTFFIVVSRSSYAWRNVVSNAYNNSLQCAYTFLKLYRSVWNAQQIQPRISVAQLRTLQMTKQHFACIRSVGILTRLGLGLSHYISRHVRLQLPRASDFTGVEMVDMGAMTTLAH